MIIRIPEKLPGSRAKDTNTCVMACRGSLALNEKLDRLAERSQFTKSQIMIAILNAGIDHVEVVDLQKE